MKPIILPHKQSIRLRPKKKRKASSTQWLNRQLNDPYYQTAKTQGWRSRAAFKLLDIQHKFNLLQSGQIIIDLGAAPGGWAQVVQVSIKPAKLILIDLLPIVPLPNTIILQKDFTDPDIEKTIGQLAGDKVDLIMSDVAPATCGHATTDHLRIIHLCEGALDLAIKLLKPKGHLIMKIFIGGEEKFLFQRVQLYFHRVEYFKPNASRQDSKEIYIIARHYKGQNEAIFSKDKECNGEKL